MCTDFFWFQKCPAIFIHRELLQLLVSKKNYPSYVFSLFVSCHIWYLKRLSFVKCHMWHICQNWQPCCAPRNIKRDEQTWWPNESLFQAYIHVRKLHSFLAFFRLFFFLMTFGCAYLWFWNASDDKLLSREYSIPFAPQFSHSGSKVYMVSSTISVSEQSFQVLQNENYIYIPERGGIFIHKQAVVKSNKDLHKKYPQPICLSTGDRYGSGSH